MQRRKKLSATISAEGYAYLDEKIRSGKAKNLPEALDAVLAEAIRVENRARLEKATAEYFEKLSPEVGAEEREISNLLGSYALEVLLNE